MHFSSIHIDGDGSASTAEQMRQWHRVMGPPDNELAGAIPFHAVLAAADGMVLALTAADAFSTGISLRLALLLRRSDPTLQDLHVRPFGSAASGILLGIVYPDGKAASNVSSKPFPGPSSQTGGLAMTERGGGGGGRTHEMNYWLTPAPPPGDIVIVTAWPARGIEETHTVIPADAIANGVSANVELWPWEPPENDPPPPLPPAPVLPAGGWFAQHVAERATTTPELR